MAVVNQLNLNVGTEQNPNFVLHDINDKRISTTAVTTATQSQMIVMISISHLHCVSISLFIML